MPMSIGRGLGPDVSWNFWLTHTEVAALVPSRLIGTGLSEQFVGDLTLTSGLIRIYRPQDTPVEGLILGRPYYGVVSTQPDATFFGPVDAEVLPSVIRSLGYLPVSTAVGTGASRTFTNSVRTGNTEGNLAASWYLQLDLGDGTGGFPLEGRTLLGTGSFPPPNTGKFWSGTPCTGLWLFVADLTFGYQTETVTGVRTNHSFSKHLRGLFNFPASWGLHCPGDPPPAPVVTAASATSTAVQVSWPAAPAGRTPLYWQWSLDNANWNRVAGDGSVTSVDVTGLVPSRQYTVYVRAVASRGNSLSGRTTFRTLARLGTNFVVAPTVSSSNLGESSATINWVAGTGGLAVAKWQWSTDNSTWTDVPGGAVPSSLSVENLTPDTAYTYYIRGVSSGGVDGAAGATSFVTSSLPGVSDTTLFGTAEAQRSLVGILGGGSLKTTDLPPLILVRSNRPAVVWDTSPFVVSPTNIYPGATLPGTEDNRLYADEFDPLPLKWSYYSLPNSAQSSVRVALNAYDTAGNLVSGSQRTLQVVNNVATFTPTGTRVTTELNQFDVAGNIAGTQAGSQGAPNGWGATPAGDSVGFARIGLQLTAQDSASPVRSTSAALLDIVPYQGLRLGDISTYNAGAGLVGFECHYYARGITATTQARNNEVAFYKWAIYRRDAAENERPVAGTIREAGQTLVATGAHWVPTGWSMGYSLQAYQNPRGQVSLVKTGFRNPNRTRLRVAFPSAETTGLLPNGDYTVRLRVIDIYGNQVGPQSFNFSVNRAGGTTTPVSTTLPPGSDAQTIAVVPVPRVYTADGTLTTTANTGLADVTQGLIPGQSIGLSVNVVGTVPSRDDLRDVVGSEGEVVNILVVQRREFSRVSGRDVDRSPRIVSGRIFINTIGGSAGAFFPTFRVLNDDGGVDAIFFDHQLESGVEYQYRCVWINKFSNRSYSTWVPA